MESQLCVLYFKGIDFSTVDDAHNKYSWYSPISFMKQYVHFSVNRDIPPWPIFAVFDIFSQAATGTDADSYHFSEIREIYETPSKYDLDKFSGYLIFPPGAVRQNITISTIHDTEEEANEAYVVRLIAATGGARVSPNNNAAILTGTEIC